MKMIKCYNCDIKFFVSNVDYDTLITYKWMYCRQTGYVRATINKKRYFLHRYILNALSKEIVDHIDGDTLNNTRENLRIVSSSENSYNSKKRINTLSVYKGVTFSTTEIRKKKWRATIQIGKKSITIGRFFTEDEAAIAYNIKALEVYGKYATINCIKTRTVIRQIPETEQKTFG